MSRFNEILGYTGAIMILLGAVLRIFELTLSPYILLVGAIMFAYVQIVHSGYEGTNFIIKRLRRQQILGAILLVVSGLMMIFLKNNEWILALTIAAVFELYTSFRLTSELDKEKK